MSTASLTTSTFSSSSNTLAGTGPATRVSNCTAAMSSTPHRRSRPVLATVPPPGGGRIIRTGWESGPEPMPGPCRWAAWGAPDSGAECPPLNRENRRYVTRYRACSDCGGAAALADHSTMDVELLVVPDCPNETAAVQLLSTALADLGLPDTGFQVTMVTSENQVAHRGFTGSPTFLIDGIDPFAQPGRPTGMSCRIYHHDDTIKGVPGLAELREALRQAVESACETPGAQFRRRIRRTR